MRAVPPPTKGLDELRQEERTAALVLSAKGGPHAVSAEMQDKVCLLNNGELLVDEHSRLDHEVFAYEEELRKAGVPYTLVKVRLSVLREHYARHAVGGGAGDDTDGESKRQKEVVQILFNAVSKRASDVHLIDERDMGLIRFRVDGALKTYAEMPAEQIGHLQATIYQSMCVGASDPTFKRLHSQDARLKEEYLRAAGGLRGARVATRPLDNGGLLMTLRLLASARTRPRLENLGYLPEAEALIIRMTQRKTGAIIFSGPTGSGKSTTLAVAADLTLEHYRGELHLLTAEDPIENKIVGARQTPVIDGDWAGAIRNAMRLDPDILMVGEIRDAESAQAAFQAAMTGHGLWTTIHANDAITILQRLKDLGVDQNLFADPSLVAGLINQSLARLLCPHCKRPWRTEAFKYAPELVERVNRFCTPETVFARGAGCEHCDGQGTRGRQVIAEVIAPSLDFMQCFVHRGKAAARDYWIREMSGISKTAHLIRRINAGVIDPFIGEFEVGPIDEIARESGEIA